MIKTIAYAALSLLTGIHSHASTQSGAKMKTECEDLIMNFGGPCLAESTSKSRTGFLPRSSRELLGFRVGRDSFPEAEGLFGKASKWHSGDAAGSEEKICYRSGDGGEQVTLVLSANGEMSGGKVDGVRVIRGPTGFSDHCAPLSEKNADVLRHKSTIHLGMSIEDMRSVLGSPVEIRGDYAFYTYCVSKTFTKADRGAGTCNVGEPVTGTRCSALTAHFEAGHLKWFELFYGADFVC
jgi:hypothetical protein